MSAISGTRASARADAPRWADGLLPGCAGVLCFSGTAPATRIAGTVFGPATLTAGRVLIAATLGVLALLLARRLRWPGRCRIPGLLVAGTGQAVGYPLFLALAVERVPAYHGAVVIGLTPAAQSLVIRDNPALISLKGLHSITSLPGHVDIQNNSSLPNLSGLEALQSIGEHLTISNNQALTLRFPDGSVGGIVHGTPKGVQLRPQIQTMPLGLLEA